MTISDLPGVLIRNDITFTEVTENELLAGGMVVTGAPDRPAR